MRKDGNEVEKSELPPFGIFLKGEDGKNRNGTQTEAGY